MRAGPADRYAASVRRDRQRRQREREERDAAKDAEHGLYSCADCHQPKPLTAYQYRYDGQTRVARRCATCRAVRRTPR